MEADSFEKRPELQRNVSSQQNNNGNVRISQKIGDSTPETVNVVGSVLQRRQVLIQPIDRKKAQSKTKSSRDAVQNSKDSRIVENDQWELNQLVQAAGSLQDYSASGIQQKNLVQSRQIQGNNQPNFSRKYSQRTLALKATHEQGVPLKENRTATGTGQNVEGRSAKAFKYNQDDSNNSLNKSYVERVFALGKNQNNESLQAKNILNLKLKPLRATEASQKIGPDATIQLGQQTLQLKPQEPFGARHQSVDAAARRGVPRFPDASQVPGSVVAWKKPSHDHSFLSGSSLNANAPLIEEVRKNNYEKVQKMMGQFMVGKNDSATITGRETQQRNRAIKNTFQTIQDQNRGNESTKMTAHPNFPGALGPKQEISVPKNLVLFQLSKFMDASEIGQRITSSPLITAPKDGPGGIESQKLNKLYNNKSFLDYLEGALPYPDAQTQVESQLGGAKTQRPIPFQGKDLNIIEGQQLNALEDNASPSLNFNVSPSQSGPANENQQSFLVAAPPSVISNWHITDLLEKSVINGAKEREQNKLRQIVEFYKRSVKGDQELNCKKGVLIRNYRLHVLKDVDQEIDERSRSLFTLNKGTSIYVSNSIIKPEIFKFGTQISDQIVQAYPELAEEVNLAPQKLTKAAKDRFFHRRSQSLASPFQDFSQHIYTAPPMAKNMNEYRNLQAEEVATLQDEINSQRARDQELEALTEEQYSQKSKRKGDEEDRLGSLRRRILDQPINELNEPQSVAQSNDSRPFTAVDDVEIQAVNKANQIFDRWLRNIMSQQSLAPESPRRATLKNGKSAALSIADINWQIALAENRSMKEKPIPLDLLTQRSFYDTTPYRHLQMLVVNQDIREWYSKFILKAKGAKSYDDIVIGSPFAFEFAECKIAIDFARHHLTHLDPVIFHDESLPLELFLDYDIWLKPFANAIRDLQVAKELVDPNQAEGIEAKSDYFLLDGTRKILDVQVHDYDPMKAKFFVKNKEINFSTWRARLFLRFKQDKDEEMDKAKVEAIRRKTETLHFIRLHKLILDEMTKRYTYLRLSNDVLQKIQTRIHIDLFQYNPDSVRKVIMQIEALYVFAILKSTLYSQRNDPFIKGMLLKYKVPISSPALYYFSAQHKEKIHLKGIEEFNMKGIKVELDNNSLLLMDEKYIKMPQFLNSVTEKTIGAHKLFRYPFDLNLLLAQSSKDFRKVKKEDLDSQINIFPLYHDKFVQAQKVMSEYFHSLAKFRWAESIKQEVWKFVKDDFNFDLGKELNENQIDPVLLRLFYQLKLYMQTVIFDHFESALRDYMRFLLSFILRDTEMKESKIIEDVKFNPWIRLSLKENGKMQFRRGEIVNDIDLLALKNKPMILIGTQIDDVEVPNKLNLKKQKVITRPELETVHRDLFSIILNMHSSLQQIDRIDAIVFPLLRLEDPYLMVPDVKNNEKLSHYVRIIEKLIEQCLKSTKKELQNINSFMYIFDKKVDNIISYLKKKSFELQQAMDDAEEEADEHEEGAQSVDASKEGEQAVEKVEERSDEDDDSYGEEDDEEGQGGEGYQGNDMAYKSVEIDDGLMKEELFFLRDLVWKVHENVFNQYDFGMVYLDCVKFKERILKHIKDLSDHLENYIRNDFTNKQRAIQAEIVGVKGKLDMEVTSIDEVIMLLDYIDSLKKQDNKIGDISVMIDEIVKRMDYIEGVQLLFPDHQYAEFLSIRNWPRTFKLYIEERKQELLAKKDDLYQEMSKEIEEVFEKIKGFKETIQEVLVQGLLEKELEYDAEDNQSLDSLGSGEQKPKSVNEAEEEAKRLEMQKMMESADGKTFPWLAKEISMEHMKFDIEHIEVYYYKIESLKSSFDEVEKATALINKRETLLGVAKTQFTELRVIQDDLKPLYELWVVASKFCRTLPQWVEGRFDTLDAGLIEGKIDEWINEMKRLQKSNLVLENAKQQELQKFIYDSLNHFKRYGPMLRTLRTKGLAPRHWRMIGQKLQFSIDPSNITLYRLIMLELYDEDKLKTIKQICEIATKEYAVQMALEQLDREMRAVEFEFMIQSDGETVTVQKLPDLIAIFEELFLRVSVLKTNPFIRNFFEKVIEIEKIIKSAVEIINEWAIFQRNFVYLNAIFCREEIAKSLPIQAKFFVVVQQLYQTTTQSFQSNPQVFKIHFRENFLSTLMKNNQDCEIIRSGLTDYLEKKRGKFPRLFFLSNEELIDIFGKGPQLIDFMIEEDSQGFITNLFEGIDQVRIHEVSQDISHMLSKDGEEVHLIKEVMTRNMSPDSWLKSLETSMGLTIKENLFLTFEQMGLQSVEEWIQSWPGQTLFLSSQIWFTMRVTSIFIGSADRERALRFAGSQKEKDDDDYAEEDDADKNRLLPISANAESDQVLLGPDGQPILSVDPDADEERAYLEEVNRQIARDEVNCPEKAQLEKILRLKQRFRINKTKSASQQMEKMRQEISNTIIQFTSLVRKKLKYSIRQSTVALLTVYVYFRDVLNGLMRDKVYKADEFKWQMQFKFNIKNELEVVYKSAFDSGSKRKLETNKLDVDFEVFGNNRNYGFEYLGNCPRLVVTPLTERCQRSLLVALQYCYGGAPEGPFGTGKTETTKDLARQVGKLCFIMNCSANYELAGVSRFFKGLASSGAWVVFDEFNRMETHILSLISQVIITIQGAIRLQSPHLQLDEQKIPLKADCAIFITLNPGYGGRTELPINLKNLFRSISMVVPDSVFITEILLYASGFIQAQQLAKKIVTVQSLANVVMNKSEIAHDFGLRSIKAIVAIAENLKLQAQNIADSDLTDVIDDYSLNQIPYKTDQVIKEVMTTSQDKITNMTDMTKNHGSSAAKLTKGKEGRGSFMLQGEELVKIDEANEIDIESNASPTIKGDKRGGTINDIDKRLTLNSIGEEVKGTDREGGGFRDSIQSLPGEENQDQYKGRELYRRLWGEASFAERQLKTVYKQIGIDPEMQYDEEELEEYIILKAVRDFNHSKFATEEHIIIEGIIKDVFQGAVPDLDKPVCDYGNLKEAIHQSFEACKIDYSQNLKIKALQFYEILRSKHGCIMVGEPQSGKSTLIYLMHSAINKAAMNEFMLTVQDKRWERLQDLAKEYESQIIQTTLQQTQGSGKGALNSSDMIGAAVKKKSKKNDKDAQAKKLLQQWQEMYKKTKLTDEEIQEIRQNLKIKGATMRRVNPKSLTIDELFGTFDKESHDWHEGVFTQYYREYANEKTNKRKWILLDGPIDHLWVENLNSILDDNKRMTLPNGESIKMTDGMCILLETNNLRNVTPATVSRCGLIHLHRKETCNPKAIFNQWIRKLPPNLTEYAKDLEITTNYLMVVAIGVYEEEEKLGRIAYRGVDLHWLMQNFVRFLTTLIFDFFIEHEKTAAQNAALQNPNELGKSLQNMTLGNKWIDMVPDPNMTIYADSESPQSQHQSQRQGSQHSQQRVQTPDPRQRELEKRKRLPRCNFIDNELRYENALKFTPIWLESFIIFAMVWTFQPVLSEAGRKLLDQKLMEKYNTARTEYSFYQKEKKKKLAEKNREKSQSNKQSTDKIKSLGRSSAIISKKSVNSEKSGSMASQAQPSKDRDSQPNNDGYSSAWTDDLEEKPMLISDYPENASFFDYFFNLESSQWNKFSLDMAINDAQIRYQSEVPSQKKIQNFFVPSHAQVRHSYILECMVTKQVSTIVVGPACSGRSRLLRETLFSHVFDFTKQLVTDHVAMSSHTDSTLFKENVERLLEWRVNKATGQRSLRPHLDNKLICYVEDLHMSWTDHYGDQSAIEAMREYLTSKAWLSSRKRRIRDIEDVSFFACMSSNSPETARVSKRILHQFNLITLDETTSQLMRTMYSSLTDMLVISWPSAIQMYANNITNALIDINSRVLDHLKPTPMKAHYTFTWRDVGKILLSIQMIESNSLRRQEHIMKLLYHECYRNYGDRLLMTHDRKWLVQILEEICRKHFYVVDEIENFDQLQPQFKTDSDGHQHKVVEEIDPKRKDQFLWPVKDPDQLFYSQWNQEVEGFYMSIDRIDEIQSVIEQNLERYNDSNERVRIDLILFNQINRLMLKALRVIGTPNGHLINVAMKGYGMNMIVKLVTFAAGSQLRELEVFEGFSKDDWHAELRRSIIYCGSDDRPLTFFVDEYKMLDDQMYVDIEGVLKNFVVTEITRKQDVTLALANIFQQIEQEKQAAKFGLTTEDDLTKEQADEQKKQQEEQKTDFIADNKLMMLKWPHIQAELYKIFLNRVKNNFHVILQYSPTGNDFRTKITKHKELLYLTQMIFMNDLPASELEALGKGFFKLEHEKAVNKAIIDGTGVPKINQYTVSKEADSQDRVLRSIVKMYLQAQEIGKKFAEEQGQIVYLTPTIFLRIFNCFKKLLKERQEIVKDIAQRYETGLDKIRQAQNAIYDYHQELERKSPILQERQKALNRVISEIEEEFNKIRSQRDQLKRDEFEAESQTDQALKIKEQCEETLNKIIPSLNEAMNSVQTLDKYEIAELKSMKKPPKVIKLVMRTVCILLGVPPAEKKSKKTGKLKLSYWQAAQGREVLGNPRFSEVLVQFDRNKVTPEIMMEVEDVLTQGDYSYEKAHTASVAATGIFKWVKATRDYFYIFKEIEPRRDAFMLSQKQHEEKKVQLAETQAKIGLLDNALQGLKVHQKEKTDIIEQLRDEIADCSIRKKRADTLLRGLSQEKQKWIVCTRMLSSKYSTVTGDVLLSAGLITILPGFNNKYRDKVIHKWAKTLNDDAFYCSKEFNFTELFGDSYKIRKWHINQLPTDIVSISNALIIEKTKRFCLLIDPQTQGITWLKNQWEEAGTLTVTNQQDSQFKKTIEMGVEMGRTIIVEQVDQTICMNLKNLMKKITSKYGGSRMIQFSRKQYKFDKNFKLFVISTNACPHFDVNVTNHITFVNFSVNVESLQIQMLGLVVLNERKDLEDIFKENSKEAFDSIQSLKIIESEILTQLEMNVSQLLGDENLIKTLDQSKNTAEYVASKLKTIAQTNQFLQKSKEVYTPVAYRAAILYFLVQDLKKVNNMYQFSLSWFKSIFQKSLELTNSMRDNPGKLASDEAEAADQSLKLLNNNFSMEERIEILIKTFTQELYKKIIVSVFEEDKKLVTYMLVIRIMQSEGYIDNNLFKFIIGGAKKVSVSTQVPSEITELPWLTNMMWADLKYLSNMKPFNASNLLQHISQFQDQWHAFFSCRGKPLTFRDLPNRELLDLRFFSHFDNYELHEQASNQLVPAGNRQVLDNQSQHHLRGTDIASMAGRTAGETHSRIGSRGHMKRTQSEILNDPEIWNLSDSDGEFSINHKSPKKDDINLNSDVEDNDQQTGLEEQEMARYLIEQAPSSSGMMMTGINNDSLRRKTYAERSQIIRRENTVKCLSELCILRCIRPDQLFDSMDRFVLNVLDPDYFDFKEEILEPYEAKKTKKGSSPYKKGGSTSQIELSKKTFGNQSKISGSQSGANQANLQHNETAGSKLNPQESEQINEKQSAGMSGTQYTTNSSGNRIAKPKVEKQSENKKKGGLNNINNLINEAFEDSSSRTPILFLISHSVNVQYLVGEFQAIKTGLKNLKYLSLGKGLEEMVDETLTRCAQNGDWIILENVHLMQEWLPVLEEKISKWRGTEVNPRFRMWLTSVPMEDFPSSILQRSIKVALQPPRTIQQKMQRMFLEQEKEQFFKKSGKNANYHKNIFFGLTYLHSILECRKKYGTLGWNVPYKFDHSDFVIGNAQLTQIIKHGSGDLVAGLDMLKYFYAHVNYAGKIQRTEDQIILNAIMSDLFNKKLAFALEQAADLSSSHYGFPTEFTDFLSFIDRELPAVDHHSIFGFNWNVESSQLKKEIFIIFDQLSWHELAGFGSSQSQSDKESNNIEMNSLKTSLRSSKSASSLQISKMLLNEESLLNLFIGLQKLLNTSSLDPTVTHGGKRYDHNTDQENLPQRDLNDQKVAQLARVLLKQLDLQFDASAIEKKFPIKYRAPMNNVINRELSAYAVLLRAIRESVADLLANIDGKYPRPLEIEALWNKIQQNKIPDSWRQVSFQTAFDSLADYIVQLGLKLEFWGKIVNADPDTRPPSYWLPAFYDPKAFLTALMQTRARLDEIPLKDLRNDFVLLDEEIPDSATQSGANVCYLYGLSLEGAEWNYATRRVVESTTTARFTPFPAVRVHTVLIAEALGPTVTPLENLANFALNQAAKRPPSSKKEEYRPEIEVEAPFHYRCPLYRSTLRLSTGLVAQENTPVQYFKLGSDVPASRWVKGAVALLLETPN